MTQPDLFTPRTMYRPGGHETSKLAATRVLPKRSALRAQVLAEFKARGPMTDATLENLPCFAGLAPSTVRKRRSELYQEGELVKVGRDKARGMAVWGVR